QKVTVHTSTQRRDLAIRWVVGPPAAIEAAARPEGDSGTWIITARVVDAGAHPVAAPLAARAPSGILAATTADGGRLETRYRGARADDPGEIVLSAGGVERRLVIERQGNIALRWLARGISTSNLASVIAGGALLAAELPLGSRLAASGETGVLVSTGDVPAS